MFLPSKLLLEEIGWLYDNTKTETDGKLIAAEESTLIKESVHRREIETFKSRRRPRIVAVVGGNTPSDLEIASPESADSTKNMIFVTSSKSMLKQGQSDSLEKLAHAHPGETRTLSWEDKSLMQKGGLENDLSREYPATGEGSLSKRLTIEYPATEEGSKRLFLVMEEGPRSNQLKTAGYPAIEEGAWSKRLKIAAEPARSLFLILSSKVQKISRQLDEIAKYLPAETPKANVKDMDACNFTALDISKLPQSGKTGAESKNTGHVGGDFGAKDEAQMAFKWLHKPSHLHRMWRDVETKNKSRRQGWS